MSQQIEDNVFNRTYRNGMFSGVLGLSRDAKSTSWFNLLNIISHSMYMLVVLVSCSYSLGAWIWPTGSLSGAVVASIYTMGTLGLLLITQFSINRVIQEDEWSERIELFQTPASAALVKSRKETFKAEIKRFIDGQTYLTVLLLIGLPFAFQYSGFFSFVWLLLIALNGLVGFVVWGEYNHAEASIKKLGSLFSGEGDEYAIE